MATRRDPALDGKPVPCRARGCTSAARWHLVDDLGIAWDVCRLHANVAERRGELDLVEAMEQLPLVGAGSV